MSKATINDQLSDLPKEQQLEEAKKVLVGSVPLIPAALDCVFDLPRGLYSNGKWETQVEVKELTGADEESLARFRNPEDFFNGVLVYGTVRIGSQDLSGLSFAERQSILSGLLIGEREQLFLHIGKVTYGNEKVIPHTCQSCGVSMETTVVISEDIKLPVMEDAYTIARTFTTSKGAVLTYRLATGADQLAVLSRKGSSLAEQNTLMISECVLEIDGKLILDPMSMARTLSMGDRVRLLEKLVEGQPSPDFSLSSVCIGCGSEVTVPFSLGDVFRP